MGTTGNIFRGLDFGVLHSEEDNYPYQIAGESQPPQPRACSLVQGVHTEPIARRTRTFSGAGTEAVVISALIAANEYCPEKWSGRKRES